MTKTMIEKEISDGILTLRLAHGKASALDLELLQALKEAFTAAEADTQLRAVILTGTGGIFSAGVDLKRILDGGEAYAQQFVPLLDQVFETQFAMTKPVVAAINGHAIAGGCILALACDIKLMANGKGRIGIPELKVGVPFPVSALEILRFSVPKSALQALLYEAETHSAEQGYGEGLVDEVLEPEDLMPRATQLASQLGAIPTASFRISKQMLRAEALAAMKQGREQFAEQINDRWSHDATYAHIRAYLEATLKK